METCVIFKGRHILVPPSMQKDFLKQLCSGHKGFEMMRGLARESVYWVKINSDIENTCKSCESCQEQHDANRHEPLLPHCLPARPWQHITTDLFQIHDRHYWLTVYRYSKYPLVDEMAVPITSRSVADKLSQYFLFYVRTAGPNFDGQWSAIQRSGIQHIHRDMGDYACDELPSLRTKQQSYGEVYAIDQRDTVNKSSDMQLALLNIRAANFFFNEFPRGHYLVW